MEQAKKRYASPIFRCVSLSCDVVTLSNYNITLDVMVKDGGVWNFADEFQDNPGGNVQ